MKQGRSMYLQMLTYGMLIGLSHASPIIGTNVRDARPDEFLFVVSIARRPTKNDVDFVNRHFCTGTLISRKSVLTAAHCLKVKTPTGVEVIAGSANVSLGDKYYPESWMTYDEWKINTNQVPDDLLINDIAIITLQGEGVKNPKIHPAAVLTFDPTDLYKSIVRIAGWGVSRDRKKPLVLKTAVLKVIPNMECNANANKLTGKNFDVPKNYFCSLAVPWVVSSCGDSGAPILNKRNQVVGINLGVCPTLDKYPQEFRYENQMNTHLHLYHYRHFIKNVRISS